MKYLFCFIAVLAQFYFIETGICQEKKITNDLEMTFIRVNPGSFQMGSPETEKGRDKNEMIHEVTISKAFYLQETEVTLKQWWAVMGKNFFLKRQGPDNLPANRVSYYDCEKFIRKLNDAGKGRYRLPTEAEWEYACRAGTTTAYSWGDTIDCSMAAFGNSKKLNTCMKDFKSRGLPVDGPLPVKSFAPNPWGFFDMHGNVWEWCSDEYYEYTESTGGNRYDAVSTTPRIRRGGSWYKYGKQLRSANRTYAHPGAKFKTTGFRLVLEAD